MAEEKKKPDAAPAGGGHADKAADKKETAKTGGGGGLLAKTPVLIGAVMVIEAIVLFAGFKFLGSGPKPAAAAELATEETSTEGDATASEHGGSSAAGHEGAAAGATEPKIDKKKIYEIDVVKDFKAPNRITGRNIIYDVAIVASVKGASKSKVEAIFNQREGLIKDRVRTIIAQCEPDKLAEPGLETLRRQVKYQLDLLVGQDMIEEVLVPRCIPFRSDF
jgi:flagellar basal body-associated protein FliL